MQYNLCLMTQTAPFQPPQESQGQKEALRVTKLKVQHFPLASRCERNSPDLLLITFFALDVVEIAVTAVSHRGGPRIVSFPSLAPYFPCVPQVQQMQGERQRSSWTLLSKAADPLWSKHWPSLPISTSCCFHLVLS